MRRSVRGTVVSSFGGYEITAFSLHSMVLAQLGIMMIKNAREFKMKIAGIALAEDTITV